MGPCGDLNPLQPGRRISLLECIVTALKNGRVGDENICVRTHDAALALGQAKQAGESSRLQTERIWLTVESGTQDLVLAVETAYWGLVQARDTLASREDAVRTTEEEAATVKARYDEKLLTRQDVDTMLRSILKTQTARWGTEGCIACSFACLCF